jgi:hypothetical protein
MDSVTMSEGTHVSFLFSPESLVRKDEADRMNSSLIALARWRRSGLTDLIGEFDPGSE